MCFRIYFVMSLRYRLAAFICCCLPLFSVAQSQNVAKTPRVLFLLDGSSSMAESWATDRSRFKQAGHFILALMDSMQQANESVEFGLRVFGHQYPSQEKNCYDTKREVAFFKGNRGQMQLRLESLHGYGVSPIAFSLSEAAAEDFVDERNYAYSIVLVTDGGESCGGDICKVVDNLLQRKIFFRPYIVSLVDYAPLRDLYACLGTFLTLSKEAEMPKTIHTIVDAHREGFERAKTGTVIPVLSTGNAIKKEVTPAEKPVIQPVEVTAIPAPRDKTIVKRIRVPLILKKINIGSEELPTPQKVTVPPFVLSKMDAPEEIVPVKTSPVIVKEIIPERKKENVFARLPFARLNTRFPVNTLAPGPKKLVVPAFVLSKMDPPPPAVETTAVVPPPPVKKPEVPAHKPPVTDKSASPYRAEKTTAEETLLEVYFTDGQGKFYTTSPQVQLSDAVTGKPVHKFYRTVNPDGNPDPQRVPAGTYNLTVVGSDRTFIKSLVVLQQMKTKIVITVSSGSLQFAYQSSSSRKNLDKYYAIVKRNFEPLPVVKQRCDTILPYPPGNYHIEINTLPPSARSVDLSFGTLVVIGIDEPGILQFKNTTRLGKVVLFYQLGDKFLPFYTIDINGDVSQQGVELKPGIYEVHYFMGLGEPEKILVFHVYSNKLTAIELE